MKTPLQIEIEREVRRATRPLLEQIEELEKRHAGLQTGVAVLTAFSCFWILFFHG